MVTHTQSLIWFVVGTYVVVTLYIVAKMGEHCHFSPGSQS